MFRVVVFVGVALAPVIALGLIAGPTPAAILLGFEIGVGIGVLWRRYRAARARMTCSTAGCSASLGETCSVSIEP